MIKNFFQKIIYEVLTVIKLNSFLQKPQNAITHDSIEDQRCFSCMGSNKLSQ